MLAFVNFKKVSAKKTHCNFFEQFWAFYWGPFWDQIGQRGGKMSPREPSGASKSQKAAFSKTLKNLKLFSVFGSRGLPREPQETREGAQETPKETPKGGPKIDQKVVKKWTQKWVKKTISLPPEYRSDRWPPAVFEDMGLSKNAYFKTLSRCLKTVPKWFKNGSRLPKLFKIAPKIRPHKDL